jgi:hypothetical protein
LNTNGIERAFFDAFITADADIGIDVMRFAFFAGDGVYRATPFAGSTTHAQFFVDNVVEQIFTMAGTTFFLDHMFVVFVVKILQSGKHRVGRGLSQTAKSSVFNYIAEIFQFIQVFHYPFALGDSFQNFIQAFIADPARGTFTA